MLDWAPWLWIALAIALAAAEMVVPSFLLIWPGAAALVVGLIVFAAPHLAFPVQLALFAVMAVVLTLGGRRYLLTHRPEALHHPALNRRAQRLVGRTGVAVGAFQAERGTVVVEGERWSANASDEVADGATVTVIAATGMVLTVKSAEASPDVLR